MLLTPDQQKRAIEVMQEYLNAPLGDDGKTPVQQGAELDANRRSLIQSTLRPLLASYLEGTIKLTDFKSKNDGINKQNEFWGFKGAKGQMFFNLLFNATTDEAECDQELKAAIEIPANEDIARSRIKTLASFVRRIGEQYVEAGGSKPGRPNPGSIPYFLSYFWQIQAPEIWPIYYTSSVNTMGDLNLWEPEGEPAEDYIKFKRIHGELMQVFSKTSGHTFDLYCLEHVFWFKGVHPYSTTKTKEIEVTEGAATISTTTQARDTIERLPESYVPPVVAILPRMAKHEPALVEAAKASGTSLERAFEKHINATFTVLGYDTKLLGAGQGRVPDGLAVDVDNFYAIVWDAKVRTDGYSMGTDDRTIREYIVTQSKDLKKKRSMRNVYYAIVSSGFADDYDDPIRSLKMDTDVSEVCLIEAEALVAMVDANLRDPQVTSLGPDGLQRLFSASGVITADLVRKTLA